MRWFAALTIYVSLGIAAASPAAAEWRELHGQALEANARQDFSQTEARLRLAWAAAVSPVEAAITANDLGVTLHTLCRDTEAKVWLQRALALWPAEAKTLSNRARTAEALAVVDRSLGSYDQAEDVLRAALALNPRDAESRAMLLNQLGDMLRELGRAAEARTAFREVLSLAGSSSQAQVGAVLGIADLDRGAHLWQASVDGWNRALAMARAEHWPLTEAGALRGLGDTLIDRGDTAHAEPLLRRALAIFESAERSQPEVASTLLSVARLMIADDKPGLATEALERALSIEEKAIGPNHPQIAIVFEMLGDAATRRGRMDDARNRYSRAQAIMVSNFGARSVMAAAVQASWALDEQRAKRDADAAKDYETALSILRESGPDTQPLVLSVMRNYADALDGAHRKHEANAVRLRMKSAFSR